MFIEAHVTPNPNAIKFSCGRAISPERPITFSALEDCKESSLAQKLMMLDGVELVFFGGDFITITKVQEATWTILRPKVVVAILEHFQASSQALNSPTITEKERTILPQSSVEARIVQILEDYIRPAIAIDGGDIEYHGFAEGVTRVKLVGSCKGCPSSTITLKHGVQNTLRYYVPEVLSVELVESEEQDSKEKTECCEKS